jgi:LruC domain-containing protein
MKTTVSNFFKISFTLLLIYGCNFASPEEIDATDGTSSVLSIPAGFDFSTHHEVTINIIDNSNYAKYDVYAYANELYNAGAETFENESGEIVTETVYKSDVLEKLIFSGVPSNGVLKQTINLSKFYNKVYIRRNEYLSFSSSIKDIVNQEVNYDSSEAKSVTKSKSIKNVTDYLYCVNGSGQLFQVDPMSGLLTDLSSMPMGSYTCAIDQEKKELYSIGRSSPYPLMKYSIAYNTWETVANIGIGGPRLDFNVNDGLLYFSKLDKLYTFNPATGALLDTWNIIGLHNLSGGDLAFAEDGTLFMCTFSGLYKLELDGSNNYQSTRISGDNLPFKPTSMTFDSNQELWLANSASSSDLIIMDTQTGGWQYNYGVSANNNTDFGRVINDLTTFRVFDDAIDDTDTDGDGIIDSDDAYPEDPEVAFELFTPSKYGKGTIAFEDLWPTTGDYDFNDAALSYQATAFLNADNLAVRLEFVCNIKANGAGFTNGIGFEIKGLTPSQIESVTGPVLTHNFINVNANGTEANQDNAVIILADAVDNILAETTIVIRFTTPVSSSELGVAPFNPFLIVNKVREKEIHLPYNSLTNLGIQSVDFNGGNKDADGNFISDNGFPWAISIIHDFKVPNEKVDITNAYNFFSAWAESGGSDFVDWYKDNPGNRNESLIDK